MYVEAITHWASSLSGRYDTNKLFFFLALIPQSRKKNLREVPFFIDSILPCKKQLKSLQVLNTSLVVVAWKAYLTIVHTIDFFFSLVRGIFLDVDRPNRQSFRGHYILWRPRVQSSWKLCGDRFFVPAHTLPTHVAIFKDSLKCSDAPCTWRLTYVTLRTCLRWSDRLIVTSKHHTHCLYPNLPLYRPIMWKTRVSITDHTTPTDRRSPPDCQWFSAEKKIQITLHTFKEDVFRAPLFF